MPKATLTTRVADLEEEVATMKAIIVKMGPEVKDHTHKFGHMRSWAKGIQNRMKQYQINAPISKRAAAKS